MFTQFLRIIKTVWTRQLVLLVAASNEKRPRCDRAWTSCLGVSFVLKESQLLAERSRNHTDRPMDGASVSQGRVLQCSFHPLFPSLSRNQPAASLVTLRDTLRSRFSSYSISFSLSLFLFCTHVSHLLELALPFYVIRPLRHVYFPFAFAHRFPLQMSPRERLTFALHPLTPFSRLAYPLFHGRLIGASSWPPKGGPLTTHPASLPCYLSFFPIFPELTFLSNVGCRLYHGTKYIEKILLGYSWLLTMRRKCLACKMYQTYQWCFLKLLKFEFRR